MFVPYILGVLSDVYEQVLTFFSLIPFRGTSTVVFLYSAWFWQDYMPFILPTMRICYWWFGTFFSILNFYFTYLLYYWYLQDERYMKKKEEKRRLKEQELSALSTSSLEEGKALLGQSK